MRLPDLVAEWHAEFQLGAGHDDPGDGWTVAQAGVRAPMVVLVEERDQSVAPILLAHVGPDVQPLVLHGEVEPLDLAVGLRRLPASASVLDASVEHGCLPL